MAGPSVPPPALRGLPRRRPTGTAGRRVAAQGMGVPLAGRSANAHLRHVGGTPAQEEILLMTRTPSIGKTFGLHGISSTRCGMEEDVSVGAWTERARVAKRRGVSCHPRSSLSSENEDRFIAMGPIESGVVVVVHTESGEVVIRVVRARRATRREVGLHRRSMDGWR